MANTPEELTALHNQGQTDAANGEAKTGTFDQYGALAEGLEGIDSDMQERGDAYRSGVDNAKKQK